MIVSITSLLRGRSATGFRSCRSPRLDQFRGVGRESAIRHQLSPQQQADQGEEDIQQVNLDVSLLEHAEPGEQPMPRTESSAARPRRGRCRAPRCEIRPPWGTGASLWAHAIADGGPSRTGRPASGRRRTKCTASGASVPRSRSPRSQPFHDGASGAAPARADAADQQGRDHDQPHRRDPVQGSQLDEARAGVEQSGCPGRDRSLEDGHDQRRRQPDQEAAGDQHAHRTDHARRRFVCVSGVFRPGRPEEDRSEHLHEASDRQCPIKASPGAAKAAPAKDVPPAGDECSEQPEIDEELADEAVQRRQAADRHRARRGSRARSTA